MSVWGDIRRQADGTSVRKEEGILRKIKDQETLIGKIMAASREIIIDRFTGQIDLNKR